MTERRGDGGRRRSSSPAEGRRGAADDYGTDRSPRSRQSRTGSGGGGRRRAGSSESSGPPRGGRRRAPSHGARSESGRGGNGGGRRRARNDSDDFDDRSRFRRFCAKAWKPFLAVSGIGMLAMIGLFGVAYAATPGPEELEAQASAVESATVVRFADESEVGSFGEVNRVPVSIDQVPDSVINGVLGSEDRRFYEDPAISPIGMARAVFSGGTAGGGSTLTQQMARNYYNTLSQERTYTRKIREILISLRVGQSLTKDQILEQYLNTIYFGRNAYGIQAAAQAYFNKNVEDLDNAEGAFLGAIIQQPGNFENATPEDPIWDVLVERWEYAVEGMVVMHDEGLGRGGISQAEASELEFPEIVARESTDSYAGYNGYIIEAAKAELRERYDLTDDQIQRGGYVVTTSIDDKLMQAAEDAVRENVPEDTPEETNYGLAAVDPATGEIRAFYGGDDVFQDTNNSLTQHGQAGSGYKPYVLAAGLEEGIGLESTFDGDSPQEFEGIEEPIQNDSNRSWGEVDLIESTAHSVNTTFVQLALEVGPQQAADMAVAAGVSPEHTETADLGANIALGTYFVTALDQAAGYATFANEGVHIPQHMVTEVVDPEGNELTPNDADELESGSRAFSADVAADATYAMQQVVENGGAQSAALPDGRPVAGKTGTSNDAASAWFTGFTPQLSTSVGLHRSDNEPLTIPGMDTLYGSTVPAAIWKDFMTVAMEDVEPQDFPEPVYVGSEQSFLPTPSPSPTPTQDAEEPEPTPTESPEPTGIPTGPPPGNEPPDWCEFDPNAPGCDEEPDPEPTETPPGGGDDDDDDGNGNGNGNGGGGFFP